MSKRKNIFAKVYVLNWFKEDFVSKNVKNIVPWTYVILRIIKVKKLVERVRKSNCKKQIKTRLELKKKLKEKATSYMSNGKAMITHLTVGWRKKT